MIGYHLNFLSMETPPPQEKMYLFVKKSSLFFRDLFEREYSPRALALLFLLALGIGSSLKALVNDSLTIGFDDYTISRDKDITDLNALEKKLIQDGSTLKKQVPKTGDTCAEEKE